MQLQRFFSIYPPDAGPSSPESVLDAEPKVICVRGKEVRGWVVTVSSDETRIHKMNQNIEDGE